MTFQTAVCLATPFHQEPYGPLSIRVGLKHVWHYNIFKPVKTKPSTGFLKDTSSIPHSDIYPYREFIEKSYQKRLELKAK
ncbi:MAG: hypothetical protein OEW86_05380 [Nitrosopumilus sp.]|nr:hypothetical protein [Nitrosopumilus sp.]